MEKIIIKKPNNFKKKSLYCGICEALLVNSQDIISSDEFNCCENCRTTWVEPRRESYLQGWRPTREEVLLEIEKRKALPLNFTV